MNSRKLLFVLFVSLLVASTAFAQGRPFGNEDPQPISDSVYRVQPGDTLWELAGDQLDDPLKWGKILGANPFLNAPGRVFEKSGKIVVVIKPDEELVIPDGLGIRMKPLPLSELRLAPLPAAEEAGTLNTLASLPWWAYGLFLVLAGFAAYWYIRHRLSNPIASGPAVIPGGIRPDEGPRLREEFQRMAAANFADRNPGAAGCPLESFLIVEVATGRFSGPWVISYRDQAPQLKMMVGEAGYRARVRFPDEREETLFSLQACFNPARLGERMFTRGGRFEEGEVVNTHPAPPEPIRRRGEQPAFRPAVSETPATETDSTIFCVGGRNITVPVGSEVRMDGNCLVIQPPAGSTAPITIALAPRRRKPAIAGRPAQPASLARSAG